MSSAANDRRTVELPVCDRQVLLAACRPANARVPAAVREKFTPVLAAAGLLVAGAA